MSAYRDRWEALLRAHNLGVALAAVGNDDETEDTPSVKLAERVAIRSVSDRERRIAMYADRIQSGLPLNPADTLTAADREELKDTDDTAPTQSKKRGRKSLASKSGATFVERMNRDVRRIGSIQAKRYRGGLIEVPAIVRATFPDEVDLASKWAEYVVSLASAQNRPISR